MAACIRRITLSQQHAKDWVATSELSSLSSLRYFNKLLPIRLITRTAMSLLPRPPAELQSARWLLGELRLSLWGRAEA